eukprot:Filipodium_phascolosomae@DN2777_c1_g2_i4.p1
MDPSSPRVVEYLATASDFFSVIFCSVTPFSLSASAGRSIVFLKQPSFRLPQEWGPQLSSKQKFCMESWCFWISGVSGHLGWCERSPRNILTASKWGQSSAAPWTVFHKSLHFIDSFSGASCPSTPGVSSISSVVSSSFLVKLSLHVQARNPPH